MNKNTFLFRVTEKIVTVLVSVIAAAVIAVLFLKSKSGLAEGTVTPPSPPASSSEGAPKADPTVDLQANQLHAVKIEPVGSYEFPVEVEAVGNIDFDEDLSVPVFSPYQGKIITALKQLGDPVEKGEALYTIDSPDLVQAESNLIGAAATLELTNKELKRAKELYSSSVGVSQRELEQAINDQQTAEGALKAARDAVRVFGKAEAEIDQIVVGRKIDPSLVVPSPIKGEITMREAQPGLLVQPGNVPAPYTVADVTIKWMLANVVEYDSPAVKTGQPVEVTVQALPGRTFEGKVSKIGAAVDPNSHTVMVRASIADPQNELRSGMLCSFTIRVKEPVEATALPAKGIVRESDGTFTAWVTADRRRFTQKIVKLGLLKDNRYQILDGLRPGELAVTDGAVFLSNSLDLPPSD
jgi:cobalt-zinc-cadmium efflux system membrane fusion protein